MENETLKLASVLADPTRFTIYQHISSVNRPVNVHEIADKFGIHPNVARLHLSKLEDVNLLKSETEKTGRGGRPSRVYALSDEIINLQFPPRDYNLLSKIAIEALLSFGEEGKKALKDIGKNFGKEAAKHAMAKDSINSFDELSIEKKVESIERLIVAQGLKPHIETIDENTVSIKLNNCIFDDAVSNIKDHNICQMHKHLLEGIFETYLGEIDLIQDLKMIDNAPSCQYTMVKLPIK